MTMSRAIVTLFFMSSLPAFAVTTTTPTAIPPITQSTPAVAVANPTTPVSAPLVEAGSATAQLPPSIVQLQQKHKLELAQQQTRLNQLEQANQKALAENQSLQLKNDNLTVQVQVLQSERSTQMFLYGAATLGVGLILGIIIYSVLYTRRRKW